MVSEASSAQPFMSRAFVYRVEMCESHPKAGGNQEETVLSFKPRPRATSILFLVISQFILVQTANALVPKQDESSLESLTFVSDALHASPHSVALDDVRGTDAAGIANAWDGFRKGHGDWNAIVDKRTGKIEVAEGEGIPFVPGRGNQLQMSDIFSVSVEGQEPGLTELEAIARAFLPDVADMLGVDPATLVLNRGRSVHPADYLWFIDFDVTLDGMPVEGARVVFRVNNGNLVQFGSENLPTAGIHTPKDRVTRNQALSVLASYVVGFSAADSFIDGGSQRLIPVALPNNQFPDGFERGKARGLTRVWQFAFRRDGDHGTWRARIDAINGKLLEFRDINDYASAQVTGGVKTSLTESKILPMPFADVALGAYTNSAGVYNYTSGNVSSALNGQYVKIIDTCGAISMTSDASGNFAFGNSSGTDDCDTPGTGGAGNTRSSRNQFYYLNRAKEIARGWLPNLSWLTSQQLTANVNLDGICNAFWDGSTVNFTRRGGSCSNSGEIQAVGLHEIGHGLDANDGSGPSPDKGTGETYGDWTATLMTHDSCIGAGYLTSNCDGFGDACTSCTGVRDIDYAKHVSATPHTVANFTQVRCPAGGGYNGPCSQEGHCESQVSSEALWDLAVRDLPNPGSESAWAIMDRLWYLSRPTATAAFTCYRATSPWSSDGCGSGSLWKTMRAVDDDDGNLSNGTPHSAALYAAFNRHGIACASDAGASTSYRACSQPTAPNLSVSAASNQVTVSWSGSIGVYDIYRNEQGCSAGGFIKVANDVSTSPFVDSAVANEAVYYYKVVAHPSGNEACASEPSSCKELIPCVPPAAPGSLTAVVSGGQVDLTWTSSPGATRYHLYRATTPGGPYTRIATLSGNTFPDAGRSCGEIYYYVVRSAKNETCESGNSTEVAATGCWEQQAYVKASNPEAGDVFGHAVAISGNTMVVGADSEDSNAMGVNGDQANNSASNAGAVYVFVRNDSAWSQQAYLKASNTDANDHFGYSVSISGDTIVVGAYGESSNATGVNGDQTNNSASGAGAAYAFVRNGSTWSQQAYLKASNTGIGDFFGSWVAISGDTIVVGALYESSNAIGVNGDQTNNSASNAGAAYAFVRNGSTWSQQAYLKASNTEGADRFGTSVSISGDTIAVGALQESSNATGVNGDQTNNSASGAGAAYVFVRAGSTWSQQAYLKASNTNSGDGFGWPVSISGDTIVVGASFEYSNATGINGDQTNNSATLSGAAYVFVRNGSTWSQQAYVKASNTDAFDRFGYSLAISGDTIVVGAYGESSNATGVNGDQTNKSATWSGAAYVFFRPPMGQNFYTVPPCRVLDTRSTGIPLTSGVPLTLSVSGTCGVPSTAKAVSLNLTAIQAPNSGSITLYLGDISVPGTSTISFSPLTNQANNTVMPLATNGSGTLKAMATITGGGSVNIVLDVNGYYQ
jgi:hypothetical protein